MITALFMVAEKIPSVLFTSFLNSHLNGPKLRNNLIYKLLKEFLDELLQMGKVILVHQIEKSDVLPWVRNLLSYTRYLTQGPYLVIQHWLYRTSQNFVIKRRYKNVRMMSVLFKMANVNAGYMYLDLLKLCHPKYARKRIQHAFVDRINKSVPWVTVWHHKALSSEPRDKIVYPIHKLMSYIPYLHTCDKLKKGIREVFFSFQGGFSRIYRKIVNSFQGYFLILSKVVCFRRNLRAHFRESLMIREGSHVCT